MNITFTTGPAKTQAGLLENVYDPTGNGLAVTAIIVNGTSYNPGDNILTPSGGMFCCAVVRPVISRDFPLDTLSLAC